MDRKYNLTVAAMFKNEGHIIQEWIEHYIKRGIDHFYLINDGSTDDFLEKIQVYIDQGLITLFHSDVGRFLGRQRITYNKYILPILHETLWMLIVDLDEFVWSPLNINLKDTLNHCNDFAQIQISPTIFGSSGHIDQPTSVVKNFTMRAIELGKTYKYFVNSNYKFTFLNVHHATFENPDYTTDGTKFIMLGPNYFRLNHYWCQSLNFWKDVKCTRGDSDNYITRNVDQFYSSDVNEIEDLDLINQNNA